MKQSLNNNLLQLRFLRGNYWLITSLVVLLMLLSFSSVSSQSNNPTWASPSFVGEGWWQSLTVDRTGTVHIAWYGFFESESEDGPQAEDLLMYTSRPYGSEWTEATDIIYPGRGGLTVRNSIVVNSEGIAFVLFRVGVNHEFSQSHVSGAANPLSWSAPRTIQGSGYYLDLLVGQNDVLHAVSSAQSTLTMRLENSPCPGCGDVVYRRSADNGKSWSAPINISDLANGADKVDIWQGPSGRLYITWDSGFDWYVGRGAAQDVRMSYSEDDGLTWSEPIVLAGEHTDRIRPIQIAAVEMPNGDLMAVWRYVDVDWNIYYQMSSDKGETWTKPEAIPGVYTSDPNLALLDDYELILDQLGNPQLFVVGQPSPGRQIPPPGVYHIAYRQGQWQRPQLIFQTEGMRPVWPKAAISPKNDIYLTWFVYDQTVPDTAQDSVAVYYSYRSPTLPDQPFLAFNPTETPPLVVAFAPQLEPTPTPYPTVEPLDPGLQTATSDLYAIRVLLVGMLAVAVLCVSVLVLSGFRLRRH